MKLKMMVNNIGEQNLLLNYLKPSHTVLEWGSGESTLAIAPRVKKLVSIEHNEEWFIQVCNRIEAEKVKNVSLYWHKPNNPEYKDDGTYEEFKDYVDFTNNFHVNDRQKYDVIFIDGRARVACAKKALELLKPKGVIFIHDYRHPKEQYRRLEYEVIEQWYDVVKGHFAMWMLKPKKGF